MAIINLDKKYYYCVRPISLKTLARKSYNTEIIIILLLYEEFANSQKVLAERQQTLKKLSRTTRLRL